MLRFILLALFSTSLYAAPLGQTVTVNDGLDRSQPSDYIELTLLSPSYQQANAIRLSIEDWLGPNMVIVIDAQTLKVQAPRDSSARVNFIAALLDLDLGTPE